MHPQLTAQGKSDGLVRIYSAVPSGQQILAIAQHRRTRTNASNALSASIVAQVQSECGSHNCRTENKQPLMQECRSPASIPSRKECHHHLSILFFFCSITAHVSPEHVVRRFRVIGCKCFRAAGKRCVVAHCCRICLRGISSVWQSSIVMERQKMRDEDIAVS